MCFIYVGKFYKKSIIFFYKVKNKLKLKFRNFSDSLKVIYSEQNSTFRAFSKVKSYNYD